MLFGWRYFHQKNSPLHFALKAVILKPNKWGVALSMDKQERINYLIEMIRCTEPMYYWKAICQGEITPELYIFLF